MAVAMDLGDPQSPFGSIHPRDKQDVGARLVLSSRAVVYKDESLYSQGPLAQSATMRYIYIYTCIYTCHAWYIHVYDCKYKHNCITVGILL